MSVPMQALRPDTPDTASRRLLRAVLERAMRDAVGPLGSGSTACTSREREQVHGWFRAANLEPMSFRWLCLVLDLEPGAVLRRLGLPDCRWTAVTRGTG